MNRSALCRSRPRAQPAGDASHHQRTGKPEYRISRHLTKVDDAVLPEALLRQMTTVACSNRQQGDQGTLPQPVLGRHQQDHETERAGLDAYETGSASRNRIGRQQQREHDRAFGDPTPPAVRPGQQGPAKRVEGARGRSVGHNGIRHDQCAPIPNRHNRNALACHTTRLCCASDGARLPSTPKLSAFVSSSTRAYRRRATGPLPP